MKECHMPGVYANAKCKIELTDGIRITQWIDYMISLAIAWKMNVRTIRAETRMVVD